MNIDGTLTLPEQIADSSGLHAAYEAWKTITKKQPDQDLL